jgi:hypothetical protein
MQQITILDAPSAIDLQIKICEYSIMQDFLYYGGLENANYYAPFAKQSGGALGFPHQNPFFYMQPYKPLWQSGGRYTGPVIRSPPKLMPRPSPAMPSRAPAKSQPPKTLWQRAKEVIKENKLISRGLGELSNIAKRYKGTEQYAPHLATASNAAGLAGWGKRKHKRKHRRAHK